MKHLLQLSALFSSAAPRPVRWSQVLGPFLLSLLAAPLLGLASIAATTPGRIEVAINGMVCSFCVQGIERKLRLLPATQAVKVDLQKHLVNITLRPGETIADDQLRKLIRDAGFDVRQIKRIDPAP